MRVEASIQALTFSVQRVDPKGEMKNLKEEKNAQKDGRSLPFIVRQRGFSMLC
jgi:hypothetical protein